MLPQAAHPPGQGAAQGRLREFGRASLNRLTSIDQPQLTGMRPGSPKRRLSALQRPARGRGLPRAHRPGRFGGAGTPRRRLGRHRPDLPHTLARGPRTIRRTACGHPLFVPEADREPVESRWEPATQAAVPAKPVRPRPSPHRCGARSRAL